MYIIGGKYKFLYFLTRITPKSWLLNITGKLYGGKFDVSTKKSAKTITEQTKEIIADEQIVQDQEPNETINPATISDETLPNQVQEAAAEEIVEKTNNTEEIEQEEMVNTANEESVEEPTEEQNEEVVEADTNEETEDTTQNKASSLFNLVDKIKNTDNSEE